MLLAPSDIHELTLANSLTNLYLIFLQAVQYSVALKRRSDILMTEYNHEQSLSEARQLSLRNSEDRKQRIITTLENTEEELAEEKLKVMRLEKEKESLIQDHHTRTDLLKSHHESDLKSRTGLLPVQPLRFPRLDEQCRGERDAARADVERLKHELALARVENMNKDAEVKRMTDQIATVEADARKKRIVDARASFGR